MSLTRLSALAGDTILPLAEAKQHLRVTHTDEDALIGSLRDASVGYVERVSGVALAPAQFRWAIRRFPAQLTWGLGRFPQSPRIDLPMAPVTAIDAVAYEDSNGVSQAYTTARLVDNAAYPVADGSWPVAYNYAAVDFTAGLDSPTDAPDLLAAALLLLGHFYENRSAVSIFRGTVAELPLGVAALIDTYRKVLA